MVKSVPSFVDYLFLFRKTFFSKVHVFVCEETSSRPQNVLSRRINKLKSIKYFKNLTAENFQRSFISEVTFNIDNVANKSVRNKLETVDGSGQECLDCVHEDFTKVNKTAIESDVFNECDECNSTILDPFNESEFFPLTELVIDTDKILNINTSSNTTSAEDHADEGIFNLETDFFKSPNESTESTQRLLRPISLAGSGEGRLLVDSEDLEAITSVDFGEEYSNKDSKSQNVHEHTTDRNDKRFLRPIFLTGSGDGGLFEDGGGVINLLEEETTSRPQNIPSRHARLDDKLNLSVEEEKSLSQSNQNHLNINIDTKIRTKSRDEKVTKENKTTSTVSGQERGCDNLYFCEFSGRQVLLAFGVLYVFFGLFRLLVVLKKRLWWNYEFIPYDEETYYSNSSTRQAVVTKSDPNHELTHLDQDIGNQPRPFVDKDLERETWV